MRYSSLMELTTWSAPRLVLIASSSDIEGKIAGGGDGPQPSQNPYNINS